MREINKSLILPLNSKNQILIQDREGHKPPPWGYFGGSIEEGETPIEGVIRETKEELNLDLSKTDLILFKEFNFERNGDNYHFNLYLYKTDRTENEFEILEGKGCKFLDFDKVKEVMKKYSSQEDVKIVDFLIEFLDSQND